jgi:SAM-dependent methyltransferase
VTRQKQSLPKPFPVEMHRTDGPIDTPSTKRYYDEHAEAYARETCNADLERVWRLLAQRVARGSLILDLGCGPGRDLAHFRKAGFRVIGLDYSLNLLRIAVNVSGQRVVVGDLGMPPFATGTFDAVWAIASLLHVPRHHIGSVLPGIRRLLKPSGVFVASIREGTGERVDERGRYFASYRRREWQTLLSDAGFGETELHVMTESRTGSGGRVMDITWLVSVSSNDRRFDRP